MKFGSHSPHNLESPSSYETNDINGNTGTSPTGYYHFNTNNNHDSTDDDETDPEGTPEEKLDDVDDDDNVVDNDAIAADVASDPDTDNSCCSSARIFCVVFVVVLYYYRYSNGCAPHRIHTITTNSQNNQIIHNNCLVGHCLLVQTSQTGGCAAHLWHGHE